MSHPRSNKPELLAPAGTPEVFAAAIEAGADAVYIGAPAFNARNLAAHFSEPQVAAMINHGHQNGVKVYLAMNSLVKEEEIPAVCDLLALCEELRPDALIIQDLGIYQLASSHFPSLPLHASTLMAAHNSLAVRHFRELGFERVVLAREMTAAEISLACQQGVEIEVFIHGALCFAYSGLCLMSSYLGGKSGLRGRCVQPCRRRYRWAGKGKKGGQGGHLFSMNDLNGLEAVAPLKEAGVSSLKIEGRMRSRHYVESVVKGYRLVLDHGDEALAQAQDLVDQAMGRTSTKGYFAGGQPADALAPGRSGNIGQFLGRVGKINHDSWVRVKLKGPLAVGDRLRIHEEKSGERHSLTLKGMRSRGEQRQEAENGWQVELQLPGGLALRPGDSLYRVDVRSGSRPAAAIKPGPFVGRVKEIKGRGKGAKVLRHLGWQEAKRRPPAGKKAGRRGRQLPIWLKSDSWRLVGQASQLRPARMVISLTPASLSQARRQKRPGRLAKVLVWSLPPVILEDELDFYQGAVAQLKRAGFFQFQISHISQLQLLQQEEAGRETGQRPRKLVISGDYTLNLLNSQALYCCRKQGVEPLNLAMEQDRDNLHHLLANKGALSAGFTIFARPPLFMARLDSEYFRHDQGLLSPKGERFILQRQGEHTVVLAEEPFSLLHELPGLSGLGLDYAVVDISGLDLNRRGLEQLMRQLDGSPGRPKKRASSSFNFNATLR
ncbi:MAG: peptidase U32 family protein [Thermodesulfobacteriota bacterium]